MGGGLESRPRCRLSRGSSVGKCARGAGPRRGRWGSRASDPPNPIRREKEPRARKSLQPSSVVRLWGPRLLSAIRVGWCWGLGAGPVWRSGVEGGVSAGPLGLGEWSPHAEPPLGRGGGCASPREGRGEGAGLGAPRPRNPGGLQGPPPARGGLCLRQLRFGKAPAGVQDGGERVGSQALATRSGPALPAMQQGEGRGHPRQRPPRPPPAAGRPPAGDPAPAAPAASVWRLQPPPHSAEPRPRQLQKMAAKAAPVATLPRRGRAPQPPAPLSVPAWGRSAGRRDPPGGAGGGSSGASGGGAVTCGQRGHGVGGGRGLSRKGALDLSPPPPRCPVPSRGRGARVGKC